MRTTYLQGKKECLLKADCPFSSHLCTEEWFALCVAVRKIVQFGFGTKEAKLEVRPNLF